MCLGTRLRTTGQRYVGDRGTPRWNGDVSGRGKGRAKSEQNQQFYVCETSKSIVWNDRSTDFTPEPDDHARAAVG